MPIPKRIKPISRFSMREEVYSTLLMWIMEGELRPGEKLLDKELAETMGVSRTPVREALRRLEDKGLVESSANRWTRVTDISIEEPEMIYPIIWTLEALAIGEASRNMTEADFDKMETANTLLEKALAVDPVGVARQHDRPVLEIREDPVAHRAVVLDQVPLGVPLLGPEHLREVGEGDLLLDRGLGHE